MTNTEFSFHQVGSFTREGLSTVQIFTGDTPLGWAEYDVDELAYYGRTNAEPSVRLEGMSATTREIAQRLLDLTKRLREYPCSAQVYVWDFQPPVLDDDGNPLAWSRLVVLGEHRVPVSGRLYYSVEFRGEEIYAHPNDVRFED
jgi:hypothetical protein